MTEQPQSASSGNNQNSSLNSGPNHLTSFTQTPELTGPNLKKSKKRVTGPIIDLLIVLVIVIVAGILLLVSHLSSSKLTCIPQNGNSVTEANAISEYKQIAEAIKESDQACSNSLSSSYFLSYNIEAGSPPKGNWIAAFKNDFKSNVVSKVTSNLINSNFIEKNYARDRIVNNGSVASYYSPAHGLVIGYPDGTRFSVGNEHYEFYFFVGFISHNGKILADAATLGPSNTQFILNTPDPYSF